MNEKSSSGQGFGVLLCLLRKGRGVDSVSQNSYHPFLEFSVYLGVYDVRVGLSF